MRSPRMPAIAGLALLPLIPLAYLNAPTAADQGHLDQVSAVSTLLDWQLIAIDTIYVDGRILLPPNPNPVAVPVPVGSLFLGFTSLAVHDAAQTAARRGRTSGSAAVATAAHDVLEHYFPNTEAKLDAALATTLAAVPDGHAETKGIRVGRRAAADLIASRGGEVLGNPTITYGLDFTKIGIWEPPPTGMAFAWLGYVDPLVLQHPVALDGHPALTSAEYTADFNEVKAVGSKAGTNTEHKAIADFFFANSVVAYERALVSYLRTHPMSLRRTARMFAVMNASMADAVREVWRLKREVGFWRPFQAIHRAGDDLNPDTVADPAWEPYRATPPYSDYPSGHAVVTGTFAETARMFLGDNVALNLVSVPQPTPLPGRPYATLTALEHDAFMARIYAGIHFRDAMDDGYYLAHETVHRVAALI